MNLSELKIELEQRLKDLDKNLKLLPVAENHYRIYYQQKPILDIKYLEDQDYIVLEDYLDKTVVSNFDTIKTDIENILIDLNFIQESLFLENRRNVMKTNKKLYEELLDIDFNEFDEVMASEEIDNEGNVLRQVVAKDTVNDIDDINDSDILDITFDDDELDIDATDDGYLDASELDDEIIPEKDDSDIGLEEVVSLDEPEVECNTISVNEANVIEKSDTKTNKKSLSQIYESKKSRQRNKIVESLLVDNVVDDIERVLKSTLDAHGVAAVDRVTILGLILDRMMHASDSDIEAPEYIDTVIDDVVEDKDIAELVKDAVESALDGDKNPRIDTIKVETTIETPEGEVTLVKELDEEEVKVEEEK